MNDRSLSKRLPLLLTAGALLFQISAILMLCAVPPVSRDALTHHLALPKIYLQKGLATELPHILFSYFPMNVDLLYMATLSFGSDTVAKYVHFAFGLMTAVLIYRLLSRWIDGAFGLLGVLLFVSLPVVTRLSISVYVDLGLAFFSTAALMAVIRWLDSGMRLRHLVVAGIFCGLALGTKYNGLLVFCILALTIPLTGMRLKQAPGPSGADAAGPLARKSPSLLTAMVVFGLVAGMLYAPWAIRNTVWTGNPIYPLYNTLFEKMPLSAVGEGNAENDRIRSLYATRINRDPLLVRRVVYKESPAEIALIPVRIFFQGEDDNPKYFDGRLHPILFLFPFLVLLNLKKDPDAKRLGKLFLLTFAWLFILMAAFSTDIRTRYLAPAVPALVVLSVCGLHSLLQFLNDHFRWRHLTTAGTLVFITIVITPSLLYVNHLFRRYSPVEYIAGRMDRDAYITHFHPEYPVLQYLNRRLPNDSKILSLFGGNRRYYYDREVFFNNQWFQSLLSRYPSDQHISLALKEQGFTHLVVNYPLYREWMYSGLPDDQKQRVDRLFEHSLKLLFEHGGYRLYRL